MSYVIYTYIIYVDSLPTCVVYDVYIGAYNIIRTAGTICSRAHARDAIFSVRVGVIALYQQNISTKSRKNVYET